MPALYKDVEMKVQEIVAVECSRCDKLVTPDDLEWQELMFWDHLGGFASIWGDGARVRVDLCQDCAYELFNRFATVE